MVKSWTAAAPAFAKATARRAEFLAGSHGHREGKTSDKLGHGWRDVEAAPAGPGCTLVI